MGWSGVQNGALLRRAAREFDVFVTFDHSIQHQQVLPQDLSLLVLRLPNNKPETVAPVVEKILERLRELPPGTVAHISPD
jgi:hypothetical protein